MTHEINLHVEVDEENPPDLLGFADMLWEQMTQQFEMTIENLEVLKTVMSNSMLVFTQKCDAEIARIRAESNPI
jgi:hypothetical protein